MEPKASGVMDQHLELSMETRASYQETAVFDPKGTDRAQTPA